MLNWLQIKNDPEGLRLLGDIHRYGLGRAVDTDTARQILSTLG